MIGSHNSFSKGSVMATKIKASRVNKRKMNDFGGRELARLWGNTPVVDAQSDARLVILQEDIDHATPANPGCCILAQACKRTFAAQKVLFFRSAAYVQLPDAVGNTNIERFRITNEVREVIEAFDRGQKVVPKAGLLLKAPSPSQTLRGQQKKQKAYTQRKKAKAKSARKGNQGLGVYKSKPIAIDLSVRNGTGQLAQFMKGKK